MNYIFIGLIAYLLGCIQTSYLAGRLLLKKDIRELGNGNAGASNATMVFGKRFGLFTAFVDIIKGIIALMLIKTFFGHDPNYFHVAGLFVIIGHNFPFYMGFKGGKGTAALVGVLFGIHWQLGLVGLLVILLVTVISDYIVLGTMSLLLVLIVSSLINELYPLVLLADGLIILMSVYKHWDNLVAIRNGQEKRVRHVLFAKK